MKGYRKLSVCVVYLVISISLLVAGFYSGEAWLKYSATILAAFFGANLFEHIGGRK